MTEQGWAPVTRKRAVLFLCSHNAARSQMGEALLRRHAGDLFEAFIADLQPRCIR